jgi:protein pelota
MRILAKFLGKKKDGGIKFRPEDDEDIWYLYNIISVRDQIDLKISRKIQSVGATGSVISIKKWVPASLEVLKIDFTYDSHGTDL